MIFLGILLAVRPTAEEVTSERDRFCRDRALASDADMREWRQANAMSESDLHELIGQKALCRRLRRWALSARCFDRGCRSLVDELRLEGVFEQWLDDAAESAQICDAFSSEQTYRRFAGMDPRDLAVHHARASGIEIHGDAQLWAEDAGFEGTKGLAEAFKRAVVADDVRRRVRRVLGAIEHMLGPPQAEGGGRQSGLGAPELAPPDR